MVIIFLLWHISVPGCVENAEYVRERPLCGPTCDDPKGKSCKDKHADMAGVTEEGCYCIDGYLWNGKMCVPAQTCTGKSV